MSMSYNDPAQVIARSISHDERPTFSGSLRQLLDYAEEHGWETDSSDENDGSIDVWGWTDQTLPNRQDWRVLVIGGSDNG